MKEGSYVINTAFDIEINYYFLLYKMLLNKKENS